MLKIKFRSSFFVLISSPHQSLHQYLAINQIVLEIFLIDPLLTLGHPGGIASDDAVLAKCRWRSKASLA